MSVNTEHKMNVAKDLKVRTSRTGVSNPKGSSLAKGRDHTSKNLVNGASADALFENRLVMMSSLRKALTN